MHILYPESFSYPGECKENHKDVKDCFDEIDEEFINQETK